MVKRDVKGIAKVTAKGRVYWYAWRERGAPRVYGEYGTADFWASYDAAICERHVPEPGKFRALVMLYKASAAYQELAPSTKRKWGPWLDRVATHFGTLSIAAFYNPKVRQTIRLWRNKYAETPRTADMGMQVLSRVCAYAVDPLGKLTSESLRGYQGALFRRSQRHIWTDADVIQNPTILHCGGCARHRPSGCDWLEARRSFAAFMVARARARARIVIPTNKSGRRVEARIPLYADLRAVLARIPKRSLTVLTNSMGRPWKTGDGLGSVFIRAKKKAGMSDLHFQICAARPRRSSAAGLPLRVIAEILGWTEGSVEQHDPQVCRPHRCDEGGDPVAR